MPDCPAPHPPAGTYAAFPATRWSLVAREQVGDTDSAAALEEICRNYWYPIYAFLRRSAVRPHDARTGTGPFRERAHTGVSKRARPFEKCRC